MPHQREKKQCAHPGCTLPARARGYCDTHYRQHLRARRGPGGTDPLDGRIYKLRIRLPDGATQPLYFSQPDVAHARAEKEEARGALIYFASYTLEERLK